MDLTRCKQILIFGGSFDPPQWAHVKLPEQVRRRLAADAVVYVPAALSPHKLDRPPTAADHRLRMLQLALDDQPRAVICTDELDRAAHDQPSYTVDTLEALHHRLPDATLRLLIGTDQARAFHRWHAPDRIEQLAEPAVMLRPPETEASFLASLPDDTQRRRWAARLIPVDPIDVSSSTVREKVRQHEAIEDLVPPPVARYIAEHGLYRE